MWAEFYSAALKIDLSRIKAIGISRESSGTHLRAREVRVYFDYENTHQVALHGEAAAQLEKAVVEWNKRNPNASITIFEIGPVQSA
ncbi:hypothetical protein OO015_13870 (plasmid) [Thermomicrobium sp. 4228-Ro]|uniref:hypothetical protein n=1 Tax=Thermomicrobium sp. 4228-Ro TaxID=2993937 RepID=UPI002248C45A|nr:hypothetical protein [Thermomicrobium sp. 4228-Ro]MCX2728573.1 hypothetical protein [Thermomicrobium sp. 4228-Ro]